MGPRLFSRGKVMNLASVTESKLLQWGRGCSAAERVGRRPLLPFLRKLQWGRGCSAAESSTHDVARVGTQRASMGPRLFSRGKVGYVGDDRRTGPLQWGRGCSAAESAAGAVRNGGLVRASMGPRLFSRGKSMPRDSARQTWTCFNGAAAVQPRKAHRASRSSSTRSGFNGAAAVQPRKVPIVGIAVRESRLASMGPRLFSRGKNHSPMLHPPLFSFNGAAAVQPRKGAVVDVVLGGSQASMGPRLFSRGKEVRHQAFPLLVDASMGPRLFSRGKWAYQRHTIWGAAGFNGAAAVQPRKARPRNS